MKIEIYNPSAPEPEQPTRLALKEYAGSIRLVAVNAAGHTVSSGNLLTFEDDGTVYRHESVNETLGFQLDSQGRIIMRGL